MATDANEPNPSDPTGRWILGCLGALLGLVLALLGKDLEEWVLLPFLVGLLVLLVRLWLGPPLLLASVAVVLWWGEPEYWYPLGRSIPDGVDWTFDALLAFSFLVYTACHYRLVSLTRNLLAREPPGSGGRPRRGPSGLHVRAPDSIASGEFAGVVLTALAGTVVAVVLAALLHHQDNPFAPQLPTHVWQAVVLLWAGGLILVVVTGLVSYLGRLQAPPRENLQYLQDQLWLDSYRDQGRLWHWLTWARLRFQRRKTRP